MKKNFKTTKISINWLNLLIWNGDLNKTLILRSHMLIWRYLILNQGLIFNLGFFYMKNQKNQKKKFKI